MMNPQDNFQYVVDRFADIQLLRYRLSGFESLTARQRCYVYYLSEAALCGRDITTDQFGRYNLQIRKLLEAVYLHYTGGRQAFDFLALHTYLRRVWFSNGIYHHYGCEKFVPEFTQEFLYEALKAIDPSSLPLRGGQTVEDLCQELFPVIFNPEVLPKRVNKSDGDDLVLTSACNYYKGVTQDEVEAFYNKLKQSNAVQPPSYGLNSTLIKDSDGQLQELTWTSDGLYAPAINQIIFWLNKAKAVAENDKQRHVIDLLIQFYNTGDLSTFDQYSIAWLQELDGQVDFINGFIEVYGDPLGLKASWEALVQYRDIIATRRTQVISDHAQWFEDHSPVLPRFKKKKVKGVSASVICAAMLGGDEYPSTAIGINLPNADWIRAQYGSKSITISNITDAYNHAARGNGFREEFVIDEKTRKLIDRYGDVCDDLHTDLHECLGHGSGQLLPGVDPDALKAYGNTIEEARADLFGLYYIADFKLVELGLVPDGEAYKSQYYTYMLNGLMTQLVRIEPGRQIEEAHMRNRALIARWTYEHSKGAVSLIRRNGKTHLLINDYRSLRELFAELLAEVQRIKSEGDYEAARSLVEKYAVQIDSDLHQEVLTRYKKLNLAPYKGFLNPWLKPVKDTEGNICDVTVDYSEQYDQQMLRYSRDYGFL